MRISEDINVNDTVKKKPLKILITVETQDHMDFIDSMLERVTNEEFIIYTTTDKVDDMVQMYSHDTGREIRRYSYKNGLKDDFCKIMKEMDYVISSNGRVSHPEIIEVKHYFLNNKPRRIKLL